MEDTIGYHRIPQFEVAFFWTSHIWDFLGTAWSQQSLQDVRRCTSTQSDRFLSACHSAGSKTIRSRTVIEHLAQMLWIRSFHSFVWGFIWKLRRNPKNPMVRFIIVFLFLVGQISHVQLPTHFAAVHLSFLVPETADLATSEHSVFDACLSAGSSERLGRCWNMVALQVKGTRLPEK